MSDIIAKLADFKQMQKYVKCIMTFHWFTVILLEPVTLKINEIVRIAKIVILSFCFTCISMNQWWTMYFVFIFFVCFFSDIIMEKYLDTRLISDTNIVPLSDVVKPASDWSVQLNGPLHFRINILYLGPFWIDCCPPHSTIF